MVGQMHLPFDATAGRKDVERGRGQRTVGTDGGRQSFGSSRPPRRLIQRDRDSVGERSFDGDWSLFRCLKRALCRALDLGEDQDRAALIGVWLVGFGFGTAAGRSHLCVGRRIEEE
jgi:hypothetical protein